MKIIFKYIIILLVVGLIVLVYKLMSVNKNDFQSMMNKPMPENAEYTKIIDMNLSKPDVRAWPGVFRSGIERGGNLLEYKIYFSSDAQFVMTLANFKSREKWEKAEPESFGKLAGTYAIKGGVIQFGNLSGNAGLMSVKARSAVQSWTPNQIVFQDENDTQVFTKIGDKPAQLDKNKKAAP
jgi:hypothetical protein